MAKIDIKGDIISNDDKMIYDWLGWDGISPGEIKSILAATPEEEAVDVYINSGGGDVFAGLEMYSALKADSRVQIHIESLAGSAAGIVAMAGKCSISPVAIIMIHNVSMYNASGDYHEMQRNVDALKRMNEAMAAAYVEKSGKSLDEILKLMDKETWLTANQCLEYGFVDEIESTPVDGGAFLNAISGQRLTDEIRENAKAEMQKAKDKEEIMKDLDLYGI